MLVTLLDDSIAFDGNSPTKQPLGGAEKAVVGMAAALARRGHVVRVFNRCDLPTAVAGVSWQPLDECQAAHSDWIIANRDPRLLGLIPNANRRALKLVAPAGYLTKVQTFALLNQFKPVLLLQGSAHSVTVPGALLSFAAGVVADGVGEAYRQAGDMIPASPAYAVVTTHPASGLDWLLTLWIDKVFPRLPWAELQVYSAILERGAQGAAVPDDLRPTLERATAAKRQGVRLCQPLADPEMVEVYRKARVHLYPGSDRDMLCTTLAESQAVGLPAVARAKGSVVERVRNGATGYLAPDDDAFANLAVRLLNDPQTFRELSDNARAQQRRHGWDAAAADLERAMA